MYRGGSEMDCNDRVVNLCEIKFSTQEYAISESEERKIRRHRSNFIETTQTHKAVHIALITPYGLENNARFAIARNQVTLNDLF